MGEYQNERRRITSPHLLARMVLSLLLLNAGGSYGQDGYGVAPLYDGHLDVFVNVGYGTGQLDWNIADTDGSPNVLSELIYDADQAIVVEAGTRLTIDSGPLDHWFGEVKGWIGFVEDGNSEDRDWNADNRGDLFSLSQSELSGDDLRRLSLALGYEFPLNQYLTLSPMVGYAYSEQNTQVTNGVQIVSEPPASGALGPFDGLNSSYEAEWTGGWVGGEAVISFSKLHDLSLRFEYHFTSYDAVANWNLRTDLAHPVSFRHSIEDQYGLLAQVQYRYPVYQLLSLMLGVDYEMLKGEEGTDMIFFSDGTNIVSPLNEANWELLRLTIGANYRF